VELGDSGIITQDGVPFTRSEAEPVIELATPLEKTRCSLLLFVATSSEKDALEAAARDRGIPFERIRDQPVGRYYWLGRIGYEDVIAVRAEGMGPLRRGGSADLAMRYMSSTQATAIVQVGMGFGSSPQDAKQKYGDVMVSSHLIPYDNRDVRSGGDRGYQVIYERASWEESSQTLLAMFMRERERRGNARTFQVHVGAMLSGAARIHSSAFRDELLRDVPAGEQPIIGGEMEAVGLLSASESPNWCVVKGIVDFADEDRDKVFEANRPIACRNAAEFVLDALLNDQPDQFPSTR
jgi:nucleoside phosphorylase